MKRQRSKRSVSERRFIYSIDLDNEGVVVGQHLVPHDVDPRPLFLLRLESSREVLKLRSRYRFYKQNVLAHVEQELARLSRLGLLGRTEFYLGVLSDPFLPFERGFDVSMGLLKLFEKYVPGHLTVQTRSPLIVIALPFLAALKDRVSITLGLETHVDRVVRHFTPELPSATERLKAARALRNFGLEVTMQAAPLLPYGDWEQDAWSFAQLLVEVGDYIVTSGITDGTARKERQLRKTKLGQKLLREKAYWWLRPDTAEPLQAAVGGLDPAKLSRPERPHLVDKQLEFFAA